MLGRSDGVLAHRHFRDLPELLRAGDLLVLNRSRVFPARLLGSRPNGGAAQILLIRPLGSELWQALVRPGRRLRQGMTVDVAEGFRVRIEDEAGTTRRVRLLVDSGEVPAAIERHGHTPLPPYIHRPDGEADRERYQTIFARETGSIAAPTAGLHFTSQLLERLAERGIETAEIVLHVGPGTFRPVEVDDVREHRVDAERYTIPRTSAEAIERARAAGHRVIAVGTTTTRALESCLDPRGRLQVGDGETGLVIIPGFHFRVVDALLTNFHLPRSSLLLLVCAFAGRERLLASYAAAVAERYRFYSYGDAMLIQ